MILTLLVAPQSKEYCEATQLRRMVTCTRSTEHGEVISTDIFYEQCSVEVSRTYEVIMFEVQAEPKTPVWS